MKINVITWDFFCDDKMAESCRTKTNLDHRLDHIFTVLIICVRSAIEFFKDLSEGMNTNPNSNKNISHKWYLILVTMVQNNHFGLRRWDHGNALHYINPTSFLVLSFWRICYSDECDLASHCQHKLPHDDKKTSSPINQCGRTTVLASHDVSQRIWYYF